MKRKKISKLLFLAALTIMAILTACPAADSTGGSKLGPVFEKLGIDAKDKKRIIVYFNTKISGAPDASRITVKRGDTTLKKTDYTPTVEDGRLVITLKVKPKPGVKYTVEIQAGAIRDANGNTSNSNTASKSKTLAVDGTIVPSITQDSLIFKANSNAVLTLSFNTNVEIVDDSKIRVEVKPDGKETFVNAPTASNRMNTKTLLELTLATAATHKNVYRVKLGTGAIRATASNLANKTELTSSKITYSTSPILDSTNRPYILNNKLVATFNLSIALKEWKKVKVYKNPTKNSDGEEITLVMGDIAVNSVSKNLLEITLPTVAEDEVYRLKLGAGAVNEEDKEANENEAISSAGLDITIGAAPVLDTGTDPYMSGQKIIVPFDAPISILDSTKIKYLLKADGEPDFGAAITPTTSKVVHNNQLEITLESAPEAGQVYRIELEIGAIIRRNSVPTVAIQPDDKDIYSTSPILDNTTSPYILDNKLVATFNLPITLRESGNVKVYKDLYGFNEEISLNQGDIAIKNKSLLVITLPPVKADEVYRLKLETGAVNEEGNADNENKTIAPAKITISTAPALDALPFLGRQKIIVTFDAPISILDAKKITYLFKANSGADFGTIIKPATTPTVLSNNQLEIPLNILPTAGQVYRIDLAAGALSGGKNKPSTGAIQTRDITVTGPILKNVTPVIASKTEFSVIFPVAVAIVGDGSKINVQKKDDDDKTVHVDESKFRTVSRRIIAVDGTNPAKINITLTGGEEITLYNQVWKVDFPANTVKTAISSISNSSRLATDESEKPRLTDLYSWKLVDQASGNLKWTARTGHTSVVFDGKIWVMGGYDGSYLNDVWSSADGVNWTESTLPVNAAKKTAGTGKNWWMARYDHTSVVFNNKIWVLGGSDDTKTLSDVWNSEDGETWEELMPPNDRDGNPVAKSTSGNNKNWWTARGRHTSVVFNPDGGAGEKIWVMGGLGNDSYHSDVWSSTDGSIWIEEDAQSQSGASNMYRSKSHRYYHASAVFDNKIWIIEGLILNVATNSVWSSTNGRVWTRGNDLPNIAVRHRMVKYKGRIWIVGGGQINSFLSSNNPATGWTVENTLPSSISNTQAVVFKNRIWLLGGDYGGTRTSNVWNIGSAPE